MNIEKILIQAGNESKPGSGTKERVYKKVKKGVELQEQSLTKKEGHSIFSWRLAYMIFPLVFAGILLIVGVPMLNQENREERQSAEKTQVSNEYDEAGTLEGTSKQEENEYFVGEDLDEKVKNSKSATIIENSLEQEPRSVVEVIVIILSISAGIAVFLGWIYIRKRN